MEKFKVKYHFSNDLSITRIVEAESKQDADNYAFEVGRIQFTDTKGVFHSFQIENVVLVQVYKVNAPKAVGFR